MPNDGTNVISEQPTNDTPTSLRCAKHLRCKSILSRLAARARTYDEATPKTRAGLHRLSLKLSHHDTTLLRFAVSYNHARIGVDKKLFIIAAPLWLQTRTAAALVLPAVVCLFHALLGLVIVRGEWKGSSVRNPSLCLQFSSNASVCTLSMAVLWWASC